MLVTEAPRALPHRVTLYTRAGCHLCEVAHRELEELRGELGFTIETVDIDHDPRLVERYGDTVPVVHVDGRLACKFRVDRGLVRRRLASD